MMTKSYRVTYRHAKQKEPAAGDVLIIEATTEGNARKLARQKLRAMFFRPIPRIAYVQERTPTP